MDQQKFPKSALMNPNFIQINEFCLARHGLILILNLDLSVIIELEIKFDVAVLRYF